MKLKEQWGTRVWEFVRTEDLVKSKLSEANGGQVEQLQEQIEMLSKMVAALIDDAGFTDRQKLEVVGLYGWELAT